MQRAFHNESMKFPFSGMRKRSFAHIPDISEAMSQMLDTVIAPMTINITGEVFTIEEVANMIARRYNVKAEKVDIASYKDQYFMQASTLFRQTIRRRS